jgi:hypothetical protein
MALFSRRFWIELTAHDRRLAAAMARYEQAVRRYRASQAFITAEAQMEFRVEFCEAITDLREVAAAMRAFQYRHVPRDRT